MPLLRKAAQAFARDASADQRSAFERFRTLAAFWWLEDYALFMSLKEAHGMRAWNTWPTTCGTGSQRRSPRRARRYAGQYDVHTVLQYLFFEQWSALRQACHDRGVRLMGDIPIYAAGDSSDVWANRFYWLIREDGNPAFMAGVPPDYFSATGQLWGNPIYRWEAHEQDDYSWWVERFRATFTMVDLVRVDHFRGFQAYWQVPWGESTAMNGEWVPGPGAKLFEAVEKQLGELPILAENLGVITPEVEAIRNRFGLPGMAILQFAFGRDPAGVPTSSRTTTRAKWSPTRARTTTTRRSAGGHRRVRATRRAPRRTSPKSAPSRSSTSGSTGTRSTGRSSARLMASVADTVIFPVQDVLGLGSEARMNMPSTVGKELEVADDAGSPDSRRQRKAAKDGQGLRPGQGCVAQGLAAGSPLLATPKF